jgi:hypothetical protein
MYSEDVQKQRRYPEERAGNISPGGWRVELDPTVFGDVAPLKVASSEVTERDLCCTISASLDLHRKLDRRGRGSYIRAEIPHKPTFGYVIPSLFSIGTQVDGLK